MNWIFRIYKLRALQKLATQYRLSYEAWIKVAASHDDPVEAERCRAAALEERDRQIACEDIIMLL